MSAQDWQPDCSLDTARLRARLRRQVRQWFDDHPALEVQTPKLDRAAVSDVQIESIAARVTAMNATMYLHTSPEYPMKRLLAAGYPDIYQLCTVFRDGEVGRRHQPEFTMLEWYRHGYSLADIVDETTRLIDALLDRAATPHGAPQQYRYDEALRTHAGVDSASTLDELRAALDDSFPDALRGERNAMLDYLFATEVAPRFDTRCLTVVTHYPRAQAALAELDEDGYALRFEVFDGALELANGFVELRDSDEQRGRFERDQCQRRALGKALRPIDERFLAALASGLPQCAGVALGFDRIVMRAAGLASIAEVTTFAHHREPAEPRRLNNA